MTITTTCPHCQSLLGITVSATPTPPFNTPTEPTGAKLEVVVMPNGEVLCLSKTVGWLKTHARFITEG